jgi:DNA-binding response OmpR family regulator/signal transduction histidine kinase
MTQAMARNPGWASNRAQRSQQGAVSHLEMREMIGENSGVAMLTRRAKSTCWTTFECGPEPLPSRRDAKGVAMKSLNLSRHRASSQAGEIVSQSRVRISICAFMGGYYAVFGLPNHPLYLAFALYSITLILIAQRVSARPHVVPISTLILDNAFAISGLGSFLLFFLIHLSFAYGIRYGRGYLVGSLLISCSGVAWLFFKSSPWQGHIHFLLSFLFGMPFISIYVYSLTGKLRRSEASATSNADRAAKLLVFLAHDIRTPLHQLLASIKNLQSLEYAAPCLPTLNSMENVVNLMARMCSGIVAGQTLTDKIGPEPSREIEEPQSATINQQLVTLVELFRQRIELEGAVLRYDLSGLITPNTTIDWVAAERALSNVISNAARYCHNGYVEIRSLAEPSDDGKIRLEVENAGSRQSIGPQRDSVSHLGPSSIYFGTAVGMTSMRDVMSSVGGAYFFRPLNDSTFLSTMIFPAGRSPLHSQMKTLLPAVVISSDDALLKRCAEMLSGAANLYFYPSFGIYSSIINSYDGEIAAIFADRTAGREADDPSSLEKFVSQNGTIVRLSSGREDRDKISIHSFEIGIDRDSERSTWLQVLQLSAQLRTHRKSLSARNEFKAGPLASAKILALDDNALNLSLLSSGLSNYGLSIKEVGSLKAAERELAQEGYDILILDWNIDRVTASELLKEIQDGPLADSLRILILTAQDMEVEEKARSRFSDRIAVLTKPTDNASIFNALKGLWMRYEDSAMDEMAVSADRIFFCDSYKDMIWNDESVRSIDGLFAKFLSDIQERISEISDCRSNVSDEEMMRNLHAMSSMCYSIGAYALGDELKEMQDALLADWSEDVSVRDGLPARVRDILVLTKMHVSMFQLSVRARGVF